MTTSRVIAVIALATVLWSGAASAAMADDVPPVVEPPVVVEPPAPPPPVVVEPPAPPPVEVSPPAPPHVETPDEYSVRTTGYTVAGWAAYQVQEQIRLAQIQAQVTAFSQQYMNTLLAYYTAHPGQTLWFDTDTGVFTDGNGVAVDISAGSVAATGGTYGVSDDASVEQLEAIIAEAPVFSLGEEPSPALTPSYVPAPVATADPNPSDGGDSATTAAAAGASWAGVVALAFWRRRYRAIELLKKLKKA